MSTSAIAATVEQNRRQFFTTAAMGIAATGAATLFSVGPAPARSADAIRPFQINILNRH